MNPGKWSPEDCAYIHENAGKLTISQMAEHVSRSELAVKLFMHRHQIYIGPTIKRNLVQEILTLKFIHPENFMPTRAFYKETSISQRRWWDLYFGRKQIKQPEYVTLCIYFGITLQEAFEARQLNLFKNDK